MTPAGLREAEAKMRREGLTDAAVATFADHYRRLAGGESGVMADSALTPVHDVPDAAELRVPVNRDALDRTVVIKLNGGLGTSMGMPRAKSLIEARDGLSFLDVIVRQVLALRRRHGVRLPLVLMNSFYTREDTLAALAGYDGLRVDVPIDLLQNKEPKLRADTLRPVEWPQRRELEWCPPGHGDLYPALAGSGMLQALRDRGYRYAFVSNADNLGAVVDPQILAWFAGRRLPFLMEVVVGTEADRKGGHIARRSDSRLVLRETAQASDQDAASFRDYTRWQYYNTNNLWMDLRALADVLEASDGVLGLPLIVNRKTVDPGDPTSPEVIQLETAMGAAISVFDDAAAVCVARTRFAPVKSTNDLLVLRSDAYRLTDQGCMELRPETRAAPPFVDLDPAYYGRIGDFESRFPFGAPSLVGCERFVVRGDATFGRGVVARDLVEISAEAGAHLQIDDGTVLWGAVPGR
jgi:UTP--glucose-1-phosphate uridylyltransferase